MNTFLSLQQAQISKVNFSKSLTTRIYERGLREQRNGLFLSHYYPNAAKRICKKTALKEFLYFSMGIRPELKKSF